MSSQNERPPPISGKTVSSSRLRKSSGSKHREVISTLNKFIPAKTNLNPAIGKIRQIGDSIPKLSDHADRLGIKLKQYDVPILGIHGTLRRASTLPYNRQKSSGKISTDLVSKFDDAIKNTGSNLTRKISKELHNVNSASTARKMKPLSSQTNSFLLGDQESIAEEMLKLHDTVTSHAEASLGYGFEQKPKPITGGHARIIKNKNANSESQRSLKAMSNKIDVKVNEWMQRNPRVDQSAANENRSARPLPVRHNTTPLPITEGDTKTEMYPHPVNENLKEISDRFHKSLSDATSNARELIKTPDDDYVQDLAKKTQESLAKMSITEGDIDAVFFNAIKREKMNFPRVVLSQDYNMAPLKSFKPLHTDLETQKKLHTYMNRRKDPFTPRPPRKDFEPDYQNPVEHFKDADLSDPNELLKRRSLIDASEPQIFQRTIEKGHLNKHRQIVDPNYRPQAIAQQYSGTDAFSSNPRSLNTISSVRAQEKGEHLKPLKVPTTAGSQGKKDLAKKYYPNSMTHNLSPDAISNKLQHSVKNIDDATKMATALGSLMSKVALANKESSQYPMELTGMLNPPGLGSKTLRPLQSPGDKLKGNNIANLAAELRQMADESQRAYHAEMNKVQQRYTNVDEMKKQDIIKYSHKNNLSLLPGVSFTDQMLLKKLKTMENIPK